MGTRRIKTFGGKKITLPIKKKEELKRVLDYLKREMETAKTYIKQYQAHRNYIMFVLGFNTAFRAEDLLQLRVKDVNKATISIKENKTGKSQLINIEKWLKDILKEYIEKYELEETDYLFMGQKTKDTHKGVTRKIIYPITRQQGTLICKKVAEACGIEYKFALHSLRKTFGYQYYQRTGELINLMKMYNHSDPTVTLLYVMWDNTDVEKARKNIAIY